VAHFNQKETAGETSSMGGIVSSAQYGQKR